MREEVHRNERATGSSVLGACAKSELLERLYDARGEMCSQNLGYEKEQAPEGGDAARLTRLTQRAIHATMQQRLGHILQSSGVLSRR